MQLKEPSPIPPNPPRWEPSADPASIPVPGLDTSAPVNDQIDQIEQLITLKLQDIDANFSKMQQVLSSRILPAFKRYSVATQPVREASKFWNSFYEQAAQVRIPTSDDYSSMYGQQEPEVTANLESEASTSHFDPNQTPSESSFLPGQAAVSSTPATTSRHRSQNPHDSFTTQGSDPSWTASLESPLVRLDRELQDFARDDQQSLTGESTFDDTANQTIHASPDKGKSREPSLRQNVLRQAVSPLKFRPKPKTPLRNPYIPRGMAPKEWSGVVDLRAPQTPLQENNDDDDDDDDLYMLPPGMSPPVTMALPTLGRTPRKEAAARIGRDLVGDAARSRYPPPRIGGGESSVSTAPTPPSLSRYARQGTASASESASISGMDSLMRRVEASGYQYAQEESSAMPMPIPEYDPRNASMESMSSDEDEDELVHNTAHPSAAFLLASRQRGRHDDDSFGSSSSGESADDDDDVGAEAVHPFARAGEAFDDSFDDDDGDVGAQEEQTLFGVPPAQRESAGGPGRIRMLGDDLMLDTGVIGQQLDRVEQSPTPWGGGQRHGSS
ncbi:hypothetical protein BV25DRAFT_1920804 [Artomyces pyxidatus]|uniref:Uncharacterized protein n=1 Tax=Artomyces pyxidatus TaxID=48021 RepID=A0ACB8SKP8_9AGAM|nr:hypothetical protein BV25DRAFT_1920804 [Artomyces pyxidatus]